MGSCWSTRPRSPSAPVDAERISIVDDGPPLEERWPLPPPAQLSRSLRAKAPPAAAPNRQQREAPTLPPTYLWQRPNTGSYADDDDTLPLRP